MVHSFQRRHPFAGFKQLAVYRARWATVRLYETPVDYRYRQVFFMSTKVGNAVYRNIFKRQMRTIFSKSLVPSGRGMGALIIPHPHCPRISYAEMEMAVHATWHKAVGRLLGGSDTAE